MSDFQPGTVAVATVRGVPNVRVLRRRCFSLSGDGWHMDWSHDAADGFTCSNDEDVTDVRPLVVLDPGDREQVERLLSALADALKWGPHNMQRETYLEPFTVALREFANPRPPKPEEPTGLGAVVEAGNGDRWVRIEAGGEKDGLFLWVCEADEDARPRPWESVNAVRVLSEGVSA